MNQEELPDYKRTFLAEMEELRIQQQLAEEQMNQTGMTTNQK